MGTNNGKVRINPVKYTKAIIILLIFCGTLVGIGVFLGKASENGETEKVSAVLIQDKISEINELATITYAYTELGQYENSKEFYGAKVPFTTSKFILTYDGIIKAGIDLSQATVEIKDKIVKIVLPEAEVLSHEILEDSVKVFDEKKSIFNPFTVKDYTKFYADQKKKAEEKAKANGIIDEASVQAADAIEKLIEPILEKEEYTLELQKITDVE